MTDMLQKTENVAKNVANENSQDLTEKWKKGELPDGHYYCKLILNNMKPSVERCKAHCIPMGVSADKGEEVLAPVPSYEEWKASEKYNKHLEEVIKIYERKDKQATETSVAYNKLLNENAQLKELLKECKRPVYWYVDIYKNKAELLTKIYEALK